MQPAMTQLLKNNNKVMKIQFKHRPKLQAKATLILNRNEIKQKQKTKE